MITVHVKKQSNYPVSTPSVKKSLQKFLSDKGIVSDAQVNVAIVGETRMVSLAEKYLDEKGIVHNVLSFPASEVKSEFVNPPDDAIHLGEIIVCFPKARDEANQEGVLIDEKVIQLVNHGALHLLGIHHE